jgi:hypothetical protein
LTQFSFFTILEKIMKTLILSIFLAFIVFSSLNALEPVRCAIYYTGGGAVTVEVQLHDYGTSANVYPGVGNKNIGSLTANSSGVISFAIGKDDAAWTAISAASITNNYMINVYVGGSVAAYIRLDQVIIEQGVYGSSIDASVISIPDGEILVGDADGDAVSRILEGDGSMSNTGELTVTGLQGRDVVSSAPANNQVLTWDNGDSRWEPKTPSPGVSLNSPNTWTQTQKFQDTDGALMIGVHTNNSNIILTNDNNRAQEIRFQEPSDHGTYYVAIRAPKIPARTSDYAFPPTVGNVGQVLGIGTKTVDGYRDSAWLEWFSMPATAPPPEMGAIAGMTNTYAYKSADENILNSTILQEDDHLALSWGNNPGTYLVEVCLLVTQNASSGIKYDFIPIGTEKFRGKYIENGKPDTDISNAIEKVGINFSGALVFKILVESPPDVTGIKFRFAQMNSGTQAAVIRKGSYMSYTKIK